MPNGPLGQAFYDQGLGAAPALAPAAAGALGLAKAAMVAGTMAVAAAGGAAMMMPSNTSSGSFVGMIYPGNTGPTDTGVPTAPLGSSIVNNMAPGGTGDVPTNGGTGPDTGPGGTAVAVPEPSALFLFAFGAVAAFVARQHAETKRRSK